MTTHRLACMFVVAPLCLLGLGLAASRPLAVSSQTTATRAAATATATTFDYRDPKGVNSIGIFLDSELEPITGYATGISGTIDYDPKHPESFSGALAVDAGKIQMSNPRMTTVLQGADWIDLQNHLTVRFEFDEVLSAEQLEEGVAKLRVQGRLTIRGIAIEKTVDVNVTHLTEGAARRGGAKSGDLLILRSQFTIDRTDFKLKPEAGFSSVARDIQLKVAIAGYSK